MRLMMSAIRRARFLVLAGVVSGLAFSPTVTKAQQIEVDKFELFFHPATGQSGESFTVRNLSDRVQTAQLTVKDWYREEDGANQFVDAGTTKGTCHPHIKIFPATIRVAPGASQSVSVTYDGGPVTTSCWSAVQVETAPQPASDARGAQLLVNIRVTVKVYVEPANARPALEVAELDVVKHVPEVGKSPADTVGNDVMARVTNPGTIQARVKGRVEYRTLMDSVVRRAAIDEFPVLPGASRRVRSRLPQLPVGRYIVLVFFDYGGAEILASQLELDLTKG